MSNIIQGISAIKNYKITKKCYYETTERSYFDRKARDRLHQIIEK